MFKLSALFLALSASLIPLQATTPQKPTQKTASPQKSAASQKPTSRNRTPGRKNAKYYAPRRSFQQTPSQDRYKEIQQALAAKGYYSGEPNGQWGSDSVDALKRFQLEQKLKGDGKLDSVSLIALGLGPKRTTPSKAGTNP